MDYTGSGVETMNPAQQTRTAYTGMIPSVAGAAHPAYASGTTLRHTQSVGEVIAQNTGSASSPTVDSYGANGGQPTFGSGLPSGLTSQQWLDLQNATQQATQGVTSGLTDQQINDKVISYLTATGRWSSAELSAVLEGIGALGNGPQGYEQGKDYQPFATQWFNAAAASVQAWLQSVLPAGQTAGNNPAFQGAQPSFDASGNTSNTGSTTSPGGSGTALDIPGLLAAALANLAPSSSTSAAPATTTTSSPSGTGGVTVIPAASTGGGSSSLVPLIILVAIAVAAFVYLRRKKGPSHE